MRVLVTVSRSWRNWERMRGILAALHERRPNAVLVHGDCPQGDRAAATFWKRLGGVDEPWPANWGRYRKAAGPLRNAAMVESNPELVIAFLAEPTTGAKATADLAEDAGITVVRYVDIRLKPEGETP